MSEKTHLPQMVNVNGKPHQIDGSDKSLLELLRDLRLTGTKKACDNGECGSCIVMMNGKPTKSCLLGAKRAVGRDVMTIEGLAPEARGFKAGTTSHYSTPFSEPFLKKEQRNVGFASPE